MEGEEWMQRMETLISSSVSSSVLKPNSFLRENFLLKSKQVECVGLNEKQKDGKNVDERPLRVVEKWVESGNEWGVNRGGSQEALMTENKNGGKKVEKKVESISGNFFPP